MLIPIKKQQFTIVPEGERILTIEEVVASPSGKPDKIKVTFRDKNGGSIKTNYTLNLKDDFIWLTGVFLGAALNLQDGEEFDTKDVPKLVGHKILVDVVHTPDKNDPEKVYANIKRIKGNEDDSELSTPNDISPRNAIIENDDEEDDL